MLPQQVPYSIHTQDIRTTVKFKINFKIMDYVNLIFSHFNMILISQFPQSITHTIMSPDILSGKCVRLLSSNAYCEL